MAATALSVVDALALGVVSFFEHYRSLRSSDLLNAYLFFTLLFDTVQCRTRWLIQKDSTAALLIGSIGVKLLILLLEVQGKMRWRVLDDRKRSPEESAGIFNLSVFFWMNKLLINGRRKVLSLEDLYPLDENMMAEGLLAKFQSQWEPSGSDGRHSRLVPVVAKTLRWHLLTPILPRLALIGFTFSQPFLVNRILKWLQTPVDIASANKGFGVIGATALVYTGIAVSTAWYWYRHQKFTALIRGMLVAAIFDNVTKLSSSSIENTATVTLMSTDIEKIQGGCRDLHEVWANTIEVALASWLLERQIGVSFLAPIVVVILCVVASLVLGKFTGKRQVRWMENIQKRVTFTASIISNMTGVKMSGLTKQVGNIVQDLRTEELKSASRSRLLMVFSTVLAFTPLLLAPVFTFAITSRHLDAARIFTSLSYLLLLSNPLTQLFQSIPQILAAITCFGRVESFLRKRGHLDYRKFRPPGEYTPCSPTLRKNAAVVVQDGQFGWEEEKPILSNINLVIPQSGLTLVVGRIASGKSTLCKGLLGELPIAKGIVVLNNSFSRIGYCAQMPFLTNGTLRENIIGQSLYQGPWYNEILEATALGHDLSTFADGDQTMIGTDGAALSGGQRARIAMARALYARPNFYIFDDTLSGLDAATEEYVFRKVFGPDGLLHRQQAAVVLCSHSKRHLALADHVIVLGSDGTIIEEGEPSALLQFANSVESVRGEFSKASHETARQPIPAQGNEHAKASDSSLEISGPARQTGDIDVYRHYFSILGIRLSILFLAFGTIFGFLYNFSSVWLKFWSDANVQSTNRDKTAYFICIYAMLQVLCLLALFFYVKHNLTTMVVKSGAVFHQRALSTLVDAPLAFFTTTDIGVTVNRFSHDMSLIDNDMAFALSNTALTGFTVLGQLTVIAVASPYVAIGYPVLFGVLYVIQNFYLKTSRQLRFLDLEAKSPL